jgi:hypothetical protein
MALRRARRDRAMDGSAKAGGETTGDNIIARPIQERSE